ncbi:MAG: PAS domain S-box protein, partial [Sulfitobacter sp.]
MLVELRLDCDLVASRAFLEHYSKLRVDILLGQLFQSKRHGLAYRCLEGAGVVMNLSEQIMESVGVALIAVDPSGCIVFSNPAATHLFGYSKEELGAVQITDLLLDWGSKHFDGQPLPPDTAVVFREVNGRHQSGKPLVLAVQFTPWTQNG